MGGATTARGDYGAEGERPGSQGNGVRGGVACMCSGVGAECRTCPVQKGVAGPVQKGVGVGGVRQRFRSGSGWEGGGGGEIRRASLVLAGRRGGIGHPLIREFESMRITSSCMLTMRASSSGLSVVGYQ